MRRARISRVRGRLTSRVMKLSLLWQRFHRVSTTGRRSGCMSHNFRYQSLPCCACKTGSLIRPVNRLHPHKDTFFSESWPTTPSAECETGRLMPMIRPTKPKKKKRAPMTLLPVRQMRPHPRPGRPNPSADSAEVARTRAEMEAAITEARKSHERLREAIDILPEGIVFLDDE